MMSGGLAPRFLSYKNKRTCMKCLVTGATGFIGSALCLELAARGVALEQTGREAPQDSQLEGAHILFHTAGIAHRGASADDYESATFDTTLALAERASAAGVSRFVFLSTVNAGPDAQPYGYWKWRTEETLRSTYESTPMEVVSVRPALVYGPGAKANLELLMGAVRRGLPTPPPGAPRSMIGLPDLCDVLCLLVDIDPGRGRVLIATDGQAYDLQRMHRAFAVAMGRPIGRAWLPLWSWRLACGILDILRRRSVGGTFEQLFGGSEQSNQELCRALSWQPRQQLEDLAVAMVEARG